MDSRLEITTGVLEKYIAFRENSLSFLLVVNYSELLTSPVQSWELMQNVKDPTR